MVSTTKTGQSSTVRFEVPGAIRRRAGDEFLLLCFVKTFQPADRDSRRLLHSVQWR